LPESKHRRRRARGRASPSNNRRAQGSTAPIHPRRRKTNWWMLAASGTVAVLVIAGFIIGDMAGALPQRGGGTADAYVEGIGEPHPIMPTANHVPDGQSVQYSTVPPTSGDHWARWSNCGFYEYEVPDELLVHNLEHGNIVVSYNLNEAGMAELRGVLNNIGGPFNTNGIARPYDAIPEGSVALAAWGVSDVMDGVDEDRIRAFFGAYAGTLGPERIPCLGTGINP
jgi:hypothetical protein